MHFGNIVNICSPFKGTFALRLPKCAWAACSCARAPSEGPGARTRGDKGNRWRLEWEKLKELNRIFFKRDESVEK